MIKPLAIATAKTALAYPAPSLIAAAGARASRRFVEFFTAEIDNANTRAAYLRAVLPFSEWCEAHRLALADIQPTHVAAYRELLKRERSKPTVKQHLSAIRGLFDYLVTGGVIPSNPASAVRSPKYQIKTGKTPVLSAVEARQLFDSIDTSKIAGLRDRALIGVMVYSFARVSAVVAMNVDDYYQQGKRWFIRLHEKGGKHHEVPAHHNLDDYLDEYLTAAAIGNAKHTPLFRSLDNHRRLTDRRLNRSRVTEMIKRRATHAGLSDRIGSHTFRATGITAYLNNGGLLEHAQEIAAHADPSTTRLYDRTSQAISLDEIERVVI